MVRRWMMLAGLVSALMTACTSLSAQYATQLLLLDNGKVVATGTPTQVLTQETIERHYAATVEVLRTTTNQLVVAPTRLPTH